MRVPNCVQSRGLAYFELTIDGDYRFFTDFHDVYCGLGYRQVEVTISDYADGLTHTIKFYGYIDACIVPGCGTNFLLDDVSVQYE